jgi:4-diphosphocytidyl-2-C-methyl-D-erythritol kinase
MTGVGEALLPLSLPKLPCVWSTHVRRDQDVFQALGLRHGGCWWATGVMRAQAWPEGSSVELNGSASSGSNLKAPATHSASDQRILTALAPPMAWLCLVRIGRDLL